jgi:peptidyl-prolyl cis-trans isomerase SurA
MSLVSSSQGYRASSSSVRTAYEVLRKETGNDGLVCPAQILIRVPQKASREEQRQAQQRIESLYRQLQDGADFGQLARQYSQDRASSEQGGVMGWYSHGQMLKEIEDVVFNMRKGEMTRPFLSTIGYHIFLMTDRKVLEDYDTLKERLSVEVGQRQVHQQISMTPLSGDALRQTETVTMETLQMPSDGLQRAYYEGLLLYEQSKNSVGRQAAEDEEALKYYFKKHKKKYRRKGFKPKDYREVRELVVADLQEEMNKHWVADLRKKYPVSVNKKVLKTVNNHH